MQATQNAARAARAEGLSGGGWRATARAPGPTRPGPTRPETLRSRLWSHGEPVLVWRLRSGWWGVSRPGMVGRRDSRHRMGARAVPCGSGWPSTRAGTCSWRAPLPLALASRSSRVLSGSTLWSRSIRGGGRTRAGGRSGPGRGRRAVGVRFRRSRVQIGSGAPRWCERNGSLASHPVAGAVGRRAGNIPCARPSGRGRSQPARAATQSRTSSACSSWPPRMGGSCGATGSDHSGRPARMQRQSPPRAGETPWSQAACGAHPANRSSGC